MKPSLITLIIVIFSLRACAQKQEKATPEIDVGENCEGCEAVFESPVPFNELNWIDTLPGFDEPGQKLAISGSIPIRKVYIRTKAMKMAGAKDMDISVGG